MTGLIDRSNRPTLRFERLPIEPDAEFSAFLAGRKKLVPMREWLAREKPKPLWQRLFPFLSRAQESNRGN